MSLFALFLLGLCCLCCFIPFDVNTAACLPFLFYYTMASAEGEGASPASAAPAIACRSSLPAPSGYELPWALVYDLDCPSARPPSPVALPALCLDFGFGGALALGLLPLCLSGPESFEFEVLEFWFLLSAPDSYFEESILICITIIKFTNKI